MSGFVSSLPSLSEAVSAIASLAFGATGGVVLGEFAFSGFEVPEYISLPGQQQMTVHKLPGGERVIDVLGDDPGDITWSGTMLDGDPWARAQQLEQMRAAGAPLPLQWGQFFYTVVIHSVTSKIMYSRVQYDISCTVLQNEATAQLAADPDLTNSIGGDIASAIGISPSELTSGLRTVQTGVAAIGALVPGSPGLAIASAQISGVASSLSGLSSLSLGNITSINSLSSAVASAGTIAHAVQSASYVGRAIRNLAS